MFLQYHLRTGRAAAGLTAPHGGIMAAVAEELSLPGEHLFRAQERLDWAARCPGGGQITVTSWRSPEHAGTNQDGAMVVWPARDRMVLAVADGVGGLPGGDSASSLALHALRDALRVRLADGADLREAVLSGFDRANRAVLQRGNGSATTLAVVEIDGERIRSYHVGDSGVLVFGGRGKVRLQTISHSPVGYAVEAGVLDEQQAMAHADRHLVSNVVGDRAMHLGLSYPLRLKPMDTVLLASDGLFDNAYTDEVIEHLRKGDLQHSAERLATRCRQRMNGAKDGAPSKPDDLTLIAYRPGVRR
jgi:serine/threonine protein phosphatase PrpC